MGLLNIYFRRRRRRNNDSRRRRRPSSWSGKATLAFATLYAIYCTITGDFYLRRARLCVCLSLCVCHRISDCNALELAHRRPTLWLPSAQKRGGVIGKRFALQTPRNTARIRSDSPARVATLQVCLANFVCSASCIRRRRRRRAGEPTKRTNQLNEHEKAKRTKRFLPNTGEPFAERQPRRRCN